MQEKFRNNIFVEPGYYDLPLQESWNIYWEIKLISRAWRIYKDTTGFPWVSIQVLPFMSFQSAISFVPQQSAVMYIHRN